MPSIRIISVHIATRIQSGLKEIGQFFLAISLVLILSSSFMWFTNLKPRGEEDAFLQADIQKTNAYLIQKQVAGIYEKAEQVPTINLINECESDINSIQLLETKLAETNELMDEIGQKIEKIERSSKSINIFNNNELITYATTVQTIVKKAKVGINEQFYRQTKTLDILKEVTEICKKNVQSDKQLAAANLEKNVKTSREYQNLDPEWENALLTWLQIVQKTDLTKPLDTTYFDQYKNLFTLNQKHSEIQMLQKTQADATTHLKNLEEKQSEIRKNLNIKHTEIILSS